jgi:hypothetical protein
LRLKFRPMALQITTYDLYDLTLWHAQWAAGQRSKSEIERTELGTGRPHGKLITRLWREKLGKETEGEHPMARKLREIEYLFGADVTEGERLQLIWDVLQR